MHRVRVGMTGLATVVLLIGVASVIFSAANRDAPVTAIGAPNAQIIANMTDDGSVNMAAEKANEPLAQLGVTPSTTATDSPDKAELKKLEGKPPADQAR